MSPRGYLESFDRDSFYFSCLGEDLYHGWILTVEVCPSVPSLEPFCRVIPRDEKSSPLTSVRSRTPSWIFSRVLSVRTRTCISIGGRGAFTVRHEGRSPRCRHEVEFYVFSDSVSLPSLSQRWRRINPKEVFLWDSLLNSNTSNKLTSRAFIPLFLRLPLPHVIVHSMAVHVLTST